MRTLGPVAALLVTLLGSTPASAQCFGPICRPWGTGVRLSFYVAPFYPPVVSYYSTWSTVYVGPRVIPVPVPVPAEEPSFADGIDLAALRERLSREQADREIADRVARGRVDQAVKRGEFVVFEPGKELPKKPAAKPAAVPKPQAPQPPADPAALARFHLHRGQEAFDAGELGRATERLTAAVAADPTLGTAHFQLAQLRLARGQYADAVDAIRSGMKNVRDWANAPFRPNALYAIRPKEQAEDLADLKAALDANPADATLTFLYAHHLWFANDRDKATELFRKLKDRVSEPELVEPFLK